MRHPAYCPRRAKKPAHDRGTVPSPALTAAFVPWIIHWSTGVFIKTNAVITAVWAGVFLSQAVLDLAGHYGPSPLLTAASHLLILPALFFTAWFQKWYPAHGWARGR